ncbi:hypothetical protein [Marinilabilia salmonicolor]|uniref:hypothetical protein n=1 Tax=Marinilabilia salmonicolor TaxID=989 RepID=UPI000299E7AB|nr:hypothetical protein [Marinilabilia salmonicolor]
MKKGIIFLMFMASLASCKTYQLTWDYPSNDTPDRLRCKQVEANEIIVKRKSIFSDEALKRIDFFYYPGKYTTIETESLSGSRLKMINNYLGADSISNYLGTCKVTLCKTKHYIEIGYLVPTVLTLTMINLLGFPIISHEVQLELKVELVDTLGENEKEIYVSGINKSFAAYYWGYSGVGAMNENSELGDITEKLALKDALEKISLQLNKNIE